MEKKNRRRAVLERALAGERAAESDEANPQQRRHHAVGPAGQANHRGHDADRPQRGRVEQGLLAGAAAVGFGDRQERDARFRVIVAIHPRDRQEVRHLPEEHDAEQDQRRQRHVAGGRAPSDHGRQGAGHRANQRGQRRARLERRIHEDVAQVRERRDCGGHRVRPQPQLADAHHRQEHAEPRALRHAQPTRGDRPLAGPLHPRVGAVLEHLVQCRGPARYQRRAEQRVHQKGQRHTAGRRQVQTGQRRQQDQQVQPRLGQRKQVGEVTRRRARAGVHRRIWRPLPRPSRPRSRGCAAMARRGHGGWRAVRRWPKRFAGREPASMRAQRQHQRRHQHQPAGDDVQRVDEVVLLAQHGQRAERDLQALRARSGRRRAVRARGAGGGDTRRARLWPAPSPPR